METIPRLPNGAIPIVRHLATAGTLYTVPAGRRLHILAAWVSLTQLSTGTPAVATGAIGINTGGAAGKGVVGDLAVRRDVVGVALPDVASAQSNAVGGVDIPVVATTVITLASSGTGSLAVSGGFTGWEEPLLAGNPV